MPLLQRDAYTSPTVNSGSTPSTRIIELTYQVAHTRIAWFHTFVRLDSIPRQEKFVRLFEQLGEVGSVFV